MLKSLVDMVRALDIAALAEGIETPQEAEVCREIGFDLRKAITSVVRPPWNDSNLLRYNGLATLQTGLNRQKAAFNICRPVKPACSLAFCMFKFIGFDGS